MISALLFPCLLSSIITSLIFHENPTKFTTVVAAVGNVDSNISKIVDDNSSRDDTFSRVKDKCNRRLPSNHDKLFNYLFMSDSTPTTGGMNEAKYNRFVVPVDVQVKNKNGQDSNVTSGAVRTQFGLSAIFLDLTPSGILKGTLWYRYSYHDPRLTFNPENFGGLDQLHVDGSLLWTPDIILFNSGDEGKAMFQTQTGVISNAIINSEGKVFIVTEVHISAYCKDSNLADFWGEQNCTLKFASWTFSGDVIELTLFENEDSTMKMDDYNNNISPLQIMRNEAFVVREYFACCDEPYISILYQLTLKRRFFIADDNKYIANPSH